MADVLYKKAPHVGGCCCWRLIVSVSLQAGAFFADGPTGENDAICGIAKRGGNAFQDRRGYRATLQRWSVGGSRDYSSDLGS